MPPSASSNSPFFVFFASVNAPRSWPNNSLSMSASGIAEQLMPMNGWLARALPKWIARAASSLPVPFSPSISTVVASLSPTRAINSRNWRICGLSPTRFSMPNLRRCARGYA